MSPDPSSIWYCDENTFTYFQYFVKFTKHIPYTMQIHFRSTLYICNIFKNFYTDSIINRITRISIVCLRIIFRIDNLTIRIMDIFDR